MPLTIKNKRKRKISLSFICLLIFFSHITYAQDSNDTIFQNLIPKNSVKENFKDILQRNNLSIQIQGSVLPKAKIHTKEGAYHLNSRLHSSFSAGINYIINLNNAWGFYSGFHFNITKSNFYKYILNNELTGTGIRRSEDAPPLIYYRDIYMRLFMPIMVKRRFRFFGSGFWNIRSGINLNYSGFSGDQGIRMSVGDTNNRQIPVFNADFESNNNSKPWVSLSLGVAKNFLLKNKNLLSAELLFEISKTNFLKADYEITIPNKPVTRGTYSVTGSGIGLSIEYTFTGVNKKFVKRQQSLTKW